MGFDPGQILQYFSWTMLLTLYGVTVGIFLLMENRSPQSTFAWLFLLVVFPIGGIIIYFMFGRSRRVFSRQRTLTRLLERTLLAERASQVINDQPEKIETLGMVHPAYGRLAGMLWATSRSPLTLGNQVDILQDAKEKYPRLMEDLRGATRSIHMVYYEWASDKFTDEVAQVLVEKVNAGVEVRVLYDPFGSLTMLSFKYLRRLRKAGVRIFPFAPLYVLHTISYRNHRKIAIIDGRIGYSGGLNMTEKHLTGPEGFTGWRDTHARLTGEAVLILQSVFATMWRNTTGESVFDPRSFPEIETRDGAPIQVVSNGPDSRWEAIRQSYLAMIALARKHVYLQSPFLIPDQSVSEAMKTAALAGLDVRLMIAPAGAEFSPAYRAGLTYAADMARAGVKVYLYKGAYFHSKTVCVDSILCSIGSANMDIRSFSINYETNLMIYDEPLTRELEADFEADLEHCDAFSAHDYEKLPLPQRFVDSALRLCSPLL